MKNTDKPNVPVPPPPVSAIQKDLQEEAKSLYEEMTAPLKIKKTRYRDWESIKTGLTCLFGPLILAKEGRSGGSGDLGNDNREGSE